MSSKRAEEYGDSHRIFLQAMMQRRVVDVTEMYEIYETSMKRGSSESYIHPTDPKRRGKQFYRFIDCLNKELARVILKIN